jgi:hypothetical protein
LKAYAVDSGLPVVWKSDDLECEQAGDEHTKLVPREPGNVAALARFKVGDRSVALALVSLSLSLACLWPVTRIG